MSGKDAVSGWLVAIILVFMKNPKHQIRLDLSQIFPKAILALTLGIVPTTQAASPAWLFSHDAEIKELVGQMTLEEKTGQMTQPDYAALRSLDDIQTLFLGSVLSGGNSDPKSGNTLADWSAMYTECQQKAQGTRLGIPLLYGIDAVHGHNNVLGAVIFPHQIGLGCTGDPALVEEVAYVTAKEVRATGIQWTFAPCLAVPQDIRWGRTYEGYSEDPQIVKSLAAAATRGLQGAQLGSPDRVVGCAKHFIGDGGTAFGTAKAGGFLDQGDVQCDETTLRKVHMAGYPEAIAAGVGTIMPSYSSWNGVKCSANKYLLTDVLKKELGFGGFLISDYNAIDQIVPPTHSTNGLEGNNAAGQVVTPDYKKCIEISINAGMDMVMVTERYPEFIKLLQELVREGKIPMARIDDAVTRILRVKFAQGLMAKDFQGGASETLKQEFGAAAHREVARKAVRSSVVVLKNAIVNGGQALLPISRLTKHILLAGHAADDIGIQCGGWTIEWQGKRGAVTTGGTTIKSALQDTAIAQRGTKITYSIDGSGAADADCIVLVLGENPYAEMHGDRKELAFADADLALFRQLKAHGKPLVVVLLTGRPIPLGEIADQADAILAAWLPGTEGAGITDVLVGDFAPAGKLSFAWPITMPAKDQAKPLFPRGYGLTWSVNAPPN